MIDERIRNLIEMVFMVVYLHIITISYMDLIIKQFDNL